MHVLRPGLTNPDARLGPSTRPKGSTTTPYATQNKILGFARMRQLRVRSDSCTVHEDFTQYLTACYGHYTTDNEDVSPYGTGAIKYADGLYRVAQKRHELSHDIMQHSNQNE